MKQSVDEKYLELMELSYKLADRYKQIMTYVREARCLFTAQICRTCFNDSANANAAARSCNRHLKRLYEEGLLGRIERQVGGYVKGSSAYIWYLTEKGADLLDLDDKYKDSKKGKKTRILVPATGTMQHNLAVAECWVQLMELAQKHPKLQIKEVTFEPNNWKYHGENNKEVLKPDLYTTLFHDSNLYSWFVEVDLGTESIQEILRKCVRYHKYLRSGIEQKQNGVFPATVWITTTPKRKQEMEDAIRHNFENFPKIFIVITADEFGKLMLAKTVKEERFC